MTLRASMPCESDVQAQGERRHLLLRAGSVVVLAFRVRPVRAGARYVYHLAVTNRDAGSPPAHLVHPEDPLSPPLLVAPSG